MTLLRPAPCASVLDPQCVQNVDKGDGHPFGPPMPDIPAMIGGNVLDEMAKAFQSAVGWFVSNTASWWVKSPSPDLENESAVGLMHQLMQPITIAVAMMALLIVAGKMTLARKADPLIDAGGGLVVLATVTAIGVLLPDQLLQWGDTWSEWVLEAASQGDFADRMSKIVTLPSGIPAGVVVIMSLAALLIGIVQAILLLFRQAALIILAGVLPLAAAGMITSATRPWFKKVTGWGLALIFYKAAAAAVYATAFVLIGDGKDLQAVLMGFAMMLISLIAFPVLLKFFDWTTGGPESSNGAGILSAVLGGATALGALRSFGAGGGSGGGQGNSAGEHADFLNQQLGQGAHGEGPSGAQPAHGAPDASATDQPTAPTPSSDEHGAPSGSDQPAGGDHPAGRGDGGDAGSPNGQQGGSGEPVGPAMVQTWNRERRRGPDMIRWLNKPSGTGEAGGPTGATDAGGGGGGGA
ncbi:hypothetical protein [Actinomadura xylanilytica]|uniref:hypothetical protein n=1 Tax=Actinomadura xylanilytica TaxID=887459 RepID=UPI00255A73F8|nr:hypothetical protein [Actinomadura xylanilytica]MDL4770737.1 hypothetical protein [Actinomadura xylanilytica]